MHLHYFAYGSNMSSRRLADRVRAQPLGVAWVPGLRLAFNKPGADGTGKANLVCAAGDRAWGVVYRLSAPELARLDRFEPGYARGLEGVWLAGRGPVRAVLYRWLAATPELAPTPAYLTHLLEGAREHGLPRHWRAALQARREP